MTMFKFFFLNKINQSLIYPIQLDNRYSITSKITFWSLPIIYDNMNNLSYYRRNRIRFFLVPFFNYFFDLNLENRILQFCQFKSKEEKYFKNLINQLLIHQYFKCYNELTLLILPPIIEYKLIREMLKYTKHSLNNKQIVFIVNNLFIIGKVNLTL